jgi:hypothetical protein
VHGVYVPVSKSSMLPTHLLPTPIEKLIADYPNGFPLMLKDQTTIMQSSTLGSGKHLAALVACAK